MIQLFTGVGIAPGRERSRKDGRLFPWPQKCPVRGRFRRFRTFFPADGNGQIFAEEAVSKANVLSTIAQTQESDHTFSAVSIMSIIV